VKHVPRIYVPGHLGPGPLVLDGDAAKRLSSVMRISPGDPFLAFSGDGREWRAAVTGVERTKLHATIAEIERQAAPPAVVVEVWLALVRAARMDWAIEKCVEAGADVIRPTVTEFCQRGDAASTAKRERWQRLAIEAAEQSGRLTVPPVEAPVPLARLLGQLRGALLVADRSGKPWPEVAALLPSSGHVAIAIGPEGGLSDDELGQATARGGMTVSLGPNIFRTETAAPVAVALIRSVGR
jgi:16S rRNA (uracil1498-N3)-methyltransferase